MSNDNLTPDSESEVIVLSNKQPNNPLIQIVVAIVIVAILAFGTYLFSSTLLNNETLVDETPQLVGEESPEDLIDEVFIADKQAEMGGDMFVEVIYNESVGVYLSHPETGQTLYKMSEGFCTDECLNDWRPYSVPFEYSAGRVRSVLVNEEFNLNYVLLDDKMLFTYIGESSQNSLLENNENLIVKPGSGVDGLWSNVGEVRQEMVVDSEWEVARP